MGNKMLLTKEGYEKLKIELQRLQKEERPMVIKAIEEARAHGDISENAEFADLRAWVLAKLMWGPDRDPQALPREPVADLLDEVERFLVLLLDFFVGQFFVAELKNVFDDAWIGIQLVTKCNDLPDRHAFVLLITQQFRIIIRLQRPIVKASTFLRLKQRSCRSPLNLFMRGDLRRNTTSRIIRAAMAGASERAGAAEPQVMTCRMVIM